MKHPPVFSSQEYDRRMNLLQAELAAADLDAFLAFTSSWFRAPGAVCYCCGYEAIFGSAMFLYIPSTAERHLLVNNFWDVIGRPEEQERKREEFHLVQDLGAEVARILPAGVRRLGVVSERFMPAPIYLSLHAVLSGIEIVDAGAQLDAVREVKSDEELAWLQYNAALSDVAARTFLEFSRPGVSEREVANEVLYAARGRGRWFLDPHLDCFGTAHGAVLRSANEPHYAARGHDPHGLRCNGWWLPWRYSTGTGVACRWPCGA